MPARFFFCATDFYWGPVLCNDLHVTRQRRCRLMAAIYFLTVTVAQFMESLFTASWNYYFWSRMETMFKVFGWDTGRYIRNFYLLITCIYKSINCHVVCRTRQKEAGLFSLHEVLYTCVFFCFFGGDYQKAEKLPVSYSLRAEEGTMSCWCEFFLLRSSLSVCVCRSVSPSHLSQYSLALLYCAFETARPPICISKPQ